MNNMELIIAVFSKLWIFWAVLGMAGIVATFDVYYKSKQKRRRVAKKNNRVKQYNRAY